MRMGSLVSVLLALTGSNAFADTFLGIKYNPLVQMNEIYEYDSATGSETLLKQFTFPSGVWSAGTSFVDPKSGLLVMKDGGGALLVYDRAENQITTLPASAVNGFQALFPAVESGGTDSLISSVDDGTLQLGDGSILRSEVDGTVHVGANSIVLADELVSASGNDEVYSSSGVLQLGNNDNHRTVIKGTLEVSNPTQANHAANKSYVDTGDAATLSSAKSYSDTGDAATLSSAKSYSNGIAAMTLAASQIDFSGDPTSSLNFGIGFGSMGGENAFALGLGGVNQNTNMRYSATASYSDTTKRVAIGAGLSWSLR